MEWLHFLVYQLWWVSDLKHASLHTKVPPWFDADFQTWAARESLLIKQERSVFFISFQHFFTPAKWIHIHMPLLSQFHGILGVLLRQGQSSGPRCHPCALRLAPLRVQVSSASLGRLDQAYYRWSASIDLNIIYIYICVYIYIDIVIGK